jgi:hypothetical protein
VSSRSPINDSRDIHRYPFFVATVIGRPIRERAVSMGLYARD